MLRKSTKVNRKIRKALVYYRTRTRENRKIASAWDSMGFGEWEANGYDITVCANDLVLRGTVSKDYKTLELTSESIFKVSWAGSRKLRLQ